LGGAEVVHWHDEVLQLEVAAGGEGGEGVVDDGGGVPVGFMSGWVVSSSDA